MDLFKLYDKYGTESSYSVPIIRENTLILITDHYKPDMQIYTGKVYALRPVNCIDPDLAFSGIVSYWKGTSSLVANY